MREQISPRAHPGRIKQTRSIIFCIVFDTHFLKCPKFQTTKNKHQPDAFMYVTPQMQKWHKRQKTNVGNFG